MHFPVYLNLGPWRLHPHMVFESLAYAIGLVIYFWLRRRYRDPISAPERWSVLTAASVGGALGSKILFWFEQPPVTLAHLRDPRFLLGGKTIVGALAGGLIAVELVKQTLGERRSTGDLFAIPLAVGIAIGRIGCFLTGLSDFTYGTPTSLPWGVDFGDGIRRHPTQLYEAAFVLALVPLLLHVMKLASRNAWSPNAITSRWNSGDAFRIFMVAYMAFRLGCDWIKPYQRVMLGMGSIQWACVLVLIYYARDIKRWLVPRASTATAKAEAHS
jgi:prolipoprotein diacylglyceryltransferase